MNYVYLIGNKNAGIYKIGVARIPEKRLKSNQTSCPYKLEIIHVFESNFAYKLEKVLQHDFSGFKRDVNENDIQGEWFCLTNKETDSFLSRCSTHEQNFNTLISFDNYHFKKFMKR